MKVIRDSGDIFSDIKKIIITENFVSIDNVPYYLTPMTIEAQTHVGFFALEDLKPMFEHMKCWKEKNGEDCEICPVKNDGVCGIMGIKDAAEKEAIEKGSTII
jgi:hypothetical protein